MSELVNVLVQLGAFIAAFAGVAGAAVMFSITKKFGLGILASSFRTTSLGVVFLAAAFIVDALSFYLQIQQLPAVSLLRELLLILGTYTIVVGAKSTADKLEKLTQ